MKSLYALVTMASLSAATQAQTVQLVNDINTGNASSQPAAFTTYNNKLYFSADDGRVGRELWNYNGSQTFIVDDVKFGTISGLPLSVSQPTKMAVMNGNLYFGGIMDTSGNAPIYGNELMVYNGSGVPTLAADIIPGSASSTPDGLMVYNSRLYFSARQVSGNGNELYSYDGFNAPVMYDINPGSGPSNPYSPFAFQNKLYFSAEGNAGRELYVLNPVSGTTTLVEDINPGGSSSPVSFVASPTKLYFIATSDNYGRELYSYDGTTVKRLTDVAQGNVDGVYNGGIAYLNGYIYFGGSTDGNNYQLYQYDIVNSATSLFATINNANSANPFGFTLYNNKVFFAATSPGFGYELWSTDGFQTSMAADISTGAASSSPSSLYMHNGMLYMTAFTAATGAELYRYTAAAGIHNIAFDGTVKVYPIPTKGDATLTIDLKQAGNLTITITDQLVRNVWESADHKFPAGKHTMVIPMQSMATGTYFYHLSNAAGAVLASGKMIKE